MLGRLEMDVDECIEAFQTISKAVFAKKKHTFSFTKRGKTQARFSSEKLKNSCLSIIEAQIKKKHESSGTIIIDDDVRKQALEMKFNDGQKRGCRT